MQPKVIDVERLKAQVRKIVAGRVLSGEVADVGLEMAQMTGCRVCVSAGYGPLSESPQVIPRDRLIWILDGYTEVHPAQGNVMTVSQGESTVLRGGMAYRLVFPKLTIYLSVEAEAKG